jgi:predicted nuclease with TOPRIM domain
VLGSFAAQGGEIEGILRDIEQSMGIMGEGFERSLETMGQGFAMFRAELEVTAIQLGNELGPAFLDILNAMRPVLAAITDMIAAFGKLPQPIQTTVIAALALATAIGPILFLVGNLTTAFGGLLRVALPLIGFLGPVGLAGVLGFAAVGMLTLREETVELTDATKELKNQTSELTGKLEDLTAAQLGQVAASIAGRIANVRAQIAELTTAVDEAERKIASMQARPMGGVVTVDPAGLREQQQAAQDASDAIANLRAQEDALRQSIIDVGLKVKEAVAAQDALNASRTTGAGSSEADKERLDAIGEALSQLSEELRAAQVQAGLFGDEFDLLDETAKSFESAIQELAPLVRDAGEALNLTKEQAAGLEQVLGDVEIAGADLFQSIINDAVRAADNIDLAKISVADLQRVLDSLGGAAPVGAGLFGAFGAGAEGAAAGAGRALAVLLDSARAAGVEVDAATMTVRDLTAAMLAVDGTALDVVLGQLRAAGVEADAATGSVGDFTAALAAVGDVETALEGLLAGVADSLDLSSTSVDQLAASLSAVDAATLDRIVAAAEGAGLAIDTSTTSVESFLGALSAVSGAGANLDNLIASAQAAGVAIDLDTMSVREFAQALAEIGGTPAFLDLTQQLGGLAEGLDVSRLSLRMFREMIVGLGVDTAIFDSLIEKLRTANTDFDTTTGTVGDFMLALTDSGIAIGALEAVMADGKVTLEEFAAAYRTMKDALADTAAADRNADAIDKIIEKLETAKATYGMTSEEIEIWKLEQMGADRALTEKAQALQADIALLNQEAAATKAAAEAAEQLKEADLAATMQLINTVADRTAGGILEAFEGIVDGSKSVAEAIGDMVTSILRDLARLMIQQQLTGLFMQVLTSFLPGGGGGSVAAAQSPGGFFPGPHLQHGGYVPRGSVALVGENGPELVSTVAGGARVTSNAELAGMVSGGAGRGVTVAQTINYNLSAIDGRNAAEFLRSNAGVIARIQQEAARQSLQHVQRTTR